MNDENPVSILSDEECWEFLGSQEFGRLAFHLAEVGISHVRIPPRSPNHNAVCERFQGTMPQECWRPAFHRRHFNSVRQLQAEANAWLIRYNTRRRNHGHYMAGRRPIDLLDTHRTNQAA